MIAYIFPGQGAQYVGMGKDLYQGFSVARETFDRADDVLGFGISRLCFEGPQEELAKTENCQLAILVASIAAYRAFANNSLNLKFRVPNYMAGLSLGEYSALVVGDALSFDDALALVKKRAEFMARAAQRYPGAMLAVIGLAEEAIKELCDASGVEIANRNCPGQVVVSGKKQAIDKFSRLAEQAGARRIIKLEVSGAFHSSLMQEASIMLEQELKMTEFHLPDIPIISNVTARPFASLAEIRNNLSLQVRRPVLWEESIGYACGRGVRRFLEIGPGKILKGLLRKIDRELEVKNIERAKDVRV
ncbi:MAG: ACP S-malonyltransferase [Candidatus Omnitrophota bacterium]